MAVLWLRFLTEINAATEEAPAELLENPATAKALSLLEKSAYNEGQLEAYDRFWYAVHRERVFYDDGFKKGHVAGREEGREEGRLDEKAETARRMKADGMTADLIAKYTGLSAEEIERL